MIGTHLCFINIKLLMKAKVPRAVAVALKQKMIPSSDLFFIFINGTASLQLQEATMSLAFHCPMQEPLSTRAH